MTDRTPPCGALDAAAALLSGRSGSLHLVYVCQTSPADMMSAQALAVTDDAFDQIARDLHEQAGKQLADRGEDRWRFERRSGIAADVLAGSPGRSATPGQGERWPSPSADPPAARTGFSARRR